MISDVLHDAIVDLDRCLKDDTGMYDEMRQRIIEVRNEMDALRAELDTPPITLN